MKKNRIDYLNQHQRPVTRRDFISRGLMAGGGVLFAPTFGPLLSTNFDGAHPFKSKFLNKRVARQIPFLVFDLAGGAALPGNFSVGGAGGALDFLPSYSMLGWNPKSDLLDNRFGLPMAAANKSGLLSGLVQTLSPEAQTRLRFSSFCHIAQADTPSNPLSALSLVMKSGSAGRVLSKGCGLRSSFSGGNSRLALEADIYRPLYVSKLEDIQDAVGLGGPFRNLSLESKIKIGQILNRLSILTAKQYSNTQLNDENLKILDSAYSKVDQVISVSIDADPRKNVELKALYNLTEQTATQNQNLLRASIVQSVVSEQSGPGVITIDGCDYHDGTSTTGDLKDLEIGLEIGRAVEFAHRMKKPLFFQIITDGGIYSAPGTRLWSGDSVDTCMTVVGYYNPDRAPVYKTLGKDLVMQIGHYTQGQGANRSTLIGESPLLAAYAVVANYLSIQGRLGEFEDLFPRIFTATQLDSVITFES